MLGFSGVYACLSLIAGDISTLRPRLMQRNGPIWQEANPASPYWRVLKKPNTYETWGQFISSWLNSKLLKSGNTYVYKQREGRGMVQELHVLEPCHTETMVTQLGDVWYRLSRDLLANVPDGDVYVPASEIIHDRAICPWHPLIGVPPVYACGLSVLQGRNIQAGSSAFFENMSRPSGHLTAPGKIDKETADRLKAEFEAGFSGKNIGRLLVTGSDLKYQTFTVIPPDQAQLIEQLKWTMEDVAACFHVPPHKLGRPASTTNSGVLKQEYYDQALRPHIEAIEALLTEGLELPADMAVELDLSGLMRMDPLARAESYAKQISAGMLKPNEARAEEDLPPVDGGDSCYLQQQNYSLSALAERDKAGPLLTPAPQPPSAEMVGDRTLRLTINGQALDVELPIPLDCGVYDPERQYQKGDGVTHNGSWWIARANVKGGKPGESPAWRLAVKAGRDRK